LTVNADSDMTVAISLFERPSATWRRGW
jgi:hypothetical protein